jgi:putative FmdB family regulatory protein
MPLYEYECQSCGKRTEVLQRFQEAPLTVCPTCGGALKKLLSAPAVQFKGSGWYVTDYAGKGSKAGKPDGKSEGGSEGKSESKSEGGSDAGKKDKEAPASASKTEAKSSGGAAGD